MMKPFLSLGSLALLAIAAVPQLSANEFAAAEASASLHGTDALGATIDAVAEADLRCHVTRLASQEYEGRGTADRGERMATAYVASFFEGLGLRPDGDAGTWFQEFDFPAGMKLAGKNSLSLRVDEPVTIVSWCRLGEHYQPMPFSTGGKVNAGVVFAGYGIQTKNYDSFEGLEVKGRWVLALRGQPKDRKDLARFGSLVAKVKKAQSLGAAGVILIKGGNPAIPDELVSLGASVRGSAGVLPAVTMTDRMASAMLDGTGGFGQLKDLVEAYHDGGRVAGYALPYRIEAEIGIAPKQDTGRNVLARLQAGDKPSAEVVVIGAHIDHLGFGDRGGSRAKGEDANRVHGGADDNASGVAALMEIAQLLAARKQRGELAMGRDIVFAAWSGEELGLRGSKAYVAQAKDGDEPLHPAVAAYLNMDMVGRARDNGLGIHGTASSGTWGKLLDSLPAIDGLKVTCSESPYVPSDSISFYNAGVPILAAFTGLHDDFHMPSDTVDKVDFAGLDRISRYMGDLTAAVAAAPAAPDYVKVERGRKGAPKVRFGVRPENNEGGGVLLTRVEEDSAASRAGLRVGDVLVRLDGKDLKNTDALFAVIRTLKPGQEYKAVVKREQNELEVTITPDAR